MPTVPGMALVHHTKNKGDLGVAKVHADLAEQGFLVLFPSTEHAPFDLVAYDESGFVRLQVKYRAVSRGSVTVHLRSAWSDRRGLHVNALDSHEVDLIAVYCPDTDGCYYVRADGCGRSVTLRITPSKNNQLIGVLPAERYRSARKPCDPSNP
jgi:PD-(D/E)XK endonuclease